VGLTLISLVASGSSLPSVRGRKRISAFTSTTILVKALADDLAEWVKADHPAFDWRQYGFQEFSELLNYAQDKGLVRIQADEERGLIVFLGAEFHPPAAPPEPEPEPRVEEEEEDEPQPLVPGQPTATGEIPLPAPPPKVMRRPRTPRKTAGSGDGTQKKRVSRPRKKPPVG